MEELLNKLIEKGWKPRGYENCIRLNANWWYISYMEDENRSIEIDKSIRDLTARESWLWQFVCENGMVKNVNDYSWELYNWEHWQYEVYKNWYEWWKRWEQVDYEYRIIESTLTDEDKLEDFILSNIKID